MEILALGARKRKVSADATQVDTEAAADSCHLESWGGGKAPDGLPASVLASPLRRERGVRKNNIPAAEAMKRGAAEKFRVRRTEWEWP